MCQCVRCEATEGGQDLDSNPLDFQMQRLAFRLRALPSNGFRACERAIVGRRVWAKLCQARISKAPGDSCQATMEARNTTLTKFAC